MFPFPASCVSCRKIKVSPAPQLHRMEVHNVSSVRQARCIPKLDSTAEADPCVRCMRLDIPCIHEEGKRALKRKARQILETQSHDERQVFTPGRIVRLLTARSTLVTLRFTEKIHQLNLDARTMWSLNVEAPVRSVQLPIRWKPQ
jgi:hypothetical protein